MVADLTPFVMTVTFYKTNSEHNRVNKVLNDAYTLNDVYLLEAQSILNPSIRVDSNDIFNYNYCYIEEYNRYYYIDDVIEEYEGLAVCKLRVDVLMTYANEIKANTAVISRNSNTFNLYYQDEQFKVLNYETVQTKAFNGSLNPNSQFVLIVAGGA